MSTQPDRDGSNVIVVQISREDVHSIDEPSQSGEVVERFGNLNSGRWESDPVEGTGTDDRRETRIDQAAKYMWPSHRQDLPYSVMKSLEYFKPIGVFHLPKSSGEAVAFTKVLEDALRSIDDPWINYVSAPCFLDGQVSAVGELQYRHTNTYRRVVHMKVHPIAKHENGSMVWTVSFLDLLLAFGTPRLLPESKWHRMMKEWHKKTASTNEKRRIWYKEIVVDGGSDESALANALYCPSVDRDFTIIAKRYGIGPRAEAAKDEYRKAYEALPRPEYPFIRGSIDAYEDIRKPVWELGQPTVGWHTAKVIHVEWIGIKHPSLNGKINHKVLYLAVYDETGVVLCSTLLGRGCTRSGDNFTWNDGDVIRVLIEWPKKKVRSRWYVAEAMDSDPDRNVSGATDQPDPDVNGHDPDRELTGATDSPSGANKMSQTPDPDPPSEDETSFRFFA